jgi:hypothetical protein
VRIQAHPQRVFVARGYYEVSCVVFKYFVGQILRFQSIYLMTPLVHLGAVAAELQYVSEPLVVDFCHIMHARFDGRSLFFVGQMDSTC